MRFCLVLMFVFLASGCSVFGVKTLEDVVAAEYKQSQEKQQQLKRLREHREQGERYYQDGQLDLAATEFFGVLELKPDDEAALYRLGNISFRRGELDKSAAFFEKVINLNPRNAKAHYNVAIIRLAQSESHFKYYAALAEKGVDLGKISDLLGDIDRFSSKDESDEGQNSLDKITGVLKSR